MALLLGKKVGMTEVYDEDGKLLPITVIQAGPCAVMQVKTTETDGYNAIQLGFDEVKSIRRKKPAVGHAQKSSVTPRRFVREMKLPGDAKPEYKAGDLINVSVFEENRFVDVTGTSKGKGFAGVMKRYKFAGMCSSHGTERKHRSPGSIASFATDRGHSGKLKKGKRMAGHMGHRRSTTKNHRIITVDAEENLLAVSGSVPGPAGGYLIVKTAKNG